MKQYYIYEIKQLANGEFEDNRSWAYDEDDTKARLKGESAYYAKLSEAAVSTYAKHSVILVSDEAFPIMYKSFKHEVEPEPQPPEEEIPEPLPDEPVEEEPIEEPAITEETVVDDESPKEEEPVEEDLTDEEMEELINEQTKAYEDEIPAEEPIVDETPEE